jgi:cyclase
MLRSRLIPCLLVHKGGLYKTVKFKDPKYVGDPLNAVRIFNEKEVDELMVLDIDASVVRREPNYELIASLAAECRMPLCYGGGVTTPDQIDRIVGLGVEKVAVSSGAIRTPSLVTESARRVGSQSVVVVLDVRKVGVLSERYEVFTHNGRQGTERSVVDVAVQMQELGAGEIVVNSVDRDGTMLGYDLDLMTEVKQAVSVPVTAVGGAGSTSHVTDLVSRFGLIGAAAGSLFVFKGKYRAVLIQYPLPDEKSRMMFRQRSSTQNGGVNAR